VWGGRGARVSLWGWAFAWTGVALWAWAELATWRASRQEYPAHAAAGPAGGEDVVLVLGFPARRDGRAGWVQRWRVRIARRSAPPGALFVFTGGAVGRSVAEADVMASLAHEAGVPHDRIVHERTARTTRENLTRSLPWVEHARTLRIASTALHARRARRYLRELDPRLHARLRPSRDFVPLEIGPLRIVSTAYETIAAAVSAHRDRHGR
jgi:uncharacterized SAM-binding protein YcdF (DUF218 family)